MATRYFAFSPTQRAQWTQLSSFVVAVGAAIGTARHRLAALALLLGLMWGTKIAPADPPQSGLALWLQAGTGVTRNGQNYVSAWADPLSGISAGQSTAANQPLWVDHALNGQPVLRFDGTRTMLATAAAVDLMGSGTDFSVFAVVRPGYTQSATSYILDYDRTNNGFQLWQPYQYPTNQFHLSWYGGYGTNGTGAWQGPVPTNLSGNVPVAYGCIKSGGAQTVYQNGAVVGTAAVPSAMVKAPHVLGVGGEVSWLPYVFNGDIAEILVYNQALSSADLQSLNAYLNQKYFTPVNLQAAPVATGIGLQWTWTPGSTSYNIKRATTTGGPYTLLGTSAAPRYTDTGVTAATTYYYVVSANRSGVESANSSEANATAGATTTVPTLLQGTGGNSQVALQWTGCAGATTYNVKRAAVAGGPYTLVNTVTTATYTDTGLVNGTRYYYVVSAVIGGVESANSSEATALPQAAPTTPTGLTATAGDAQVLLSWTASLRATTYDVWRATEGGAWTQIKTLAVVNYTDTGLTNGTQYSYYVTAHNTTGDSDDSTPVSVTPAVTPATAPGVPTFTSVTATTMQSIAPPLPFGATSLTLQRQAGGSMGMGSSYVDVVSGLAGGAVTTISNLTPNSSYTFRYVAVGTGGTTPGNTASVSTLPPVPGLPDAPVLSGLSAAGGTVYGPPLPEWAQSLNLQIKLQADPDTAYSDYATGISGNNNTSVTGLSAATAYTCRYVALGAGGTTAGPGAPFTTTPGVPGSPSFSNVTDSGMTLTAPSLPTGATSLTLQLQTSTYANYQTTYQYANLATGLAGGATTTLTGLLSSSSYNFRYLAVGPSGNTGGSVGYQYTNSGSSVTPGAPIFANATSSSIDVSARDNLPYDYYNYSSQWHLQYKLQTDPDTAYTTYYSSQYGYCATTVSGLSAGTTYSFRYVKDSIIGASADATTLTAGPGTPTFSAVTSTGCTVTSPALPTGATSLTLQRQVGASGYYYYYGTPTYVDVATGLAGGATTTLTGLTPGQSYTYRYTALETAGSSPGSTASVTTLPPAPGVPAAPDLTSVASTSLTANLPPPPPDTATFTLQQKLQGDPDTNYTDVQSGITANSYYGTSVNVTGLSAQTAYAFRVVAVGGGGSTPGPEADVTTLAPPPAMPGNPSFSNVGSTSLTITLPDLPTGATSLSLQRTQAAQYYTFITVATGKPGEAVFQVTGLTPSSYYSFHVVAVGPGGSTTGYDVGVQTDNGAPPAPDAPHFSYLTEDSVLVTAPALPDGVYSLTLQMKYSSQPDTAYMNIAANIGSAGTVTPINGLDSGVSYDFRYVAVAYGGSTPGAAGTVLVPTAAITWGPGRPISCGGIHYPATGQTIPAGQSGRLSAYLATDWDDRAMTVNGATTVEEFSDPCSYTWTATGGSFENGINTGQSPVWVAPTTPGTYTITLTVDDQNAANQPANQGGNRDDVARGYNDDPLHFSVIITVQ